jgi:hypothetical protein
MSLARSPLRMSISAFTPDTAVRVKGLGQNRSSPDSPERAGWVALKFSGLTAIQCGYLKYLIAPSPAPPSGEPAGSTAFSS